MKKRVTSLKVFLKLVRLFSKQLEKIRNERIRIKCVYPRLRTDRSALLQSRRSHDRYRQHCELILSIGSPLTTIQKLYFS